MATPGLTTVALKDAQGNPLTGIAAQNASGQMDAAHVLVDQYGNLITSANALPTMRPQVTPVAAAALTIAAGGTAQSLFAAGQCPNGYRVVNPTTATETLYVDDTGAPASPTSAGAIPIPPGTMYESPYAPTTAVSIYGATTSHAFSAVRY